MQTINFVPGTERRQFGRKEVSFDALAQSPGRSAVRCKIRNISPVGALLEFEAPFSSRGNFRLYIEGKLDVACSIRRQDSNIIGVEFTSIILHDLIQATSKSAATTPVYQGVQKREVAASSGFEMRARLFGRTVAERLARAADVAVTH